ncbi:response regulator transcription factor [Tsuneonella sp. HG222]
MRAKIALVDRDPGRRASVSRLLLGAEYHVEPYETPGELALDRRRPDLLLVHDEGSDLAQVFGVLLRKDSWDPVIAYAADAPIARVSQVLSTGVMEYLAWPMDENVLARSAESALENQGKLATLHRKAFAARGIFRRLSTREQQVLMSLSRGMSNKEIARELDISSRTVEIHRANMQGKLREEDWTLPVEVAFYLRVPSIADADALDPAPGVSFPGRPDTER